MALDSLGRIRVQRADQVEGLNVGHGIRAGRASDRRLVDHDHFFEQRRAFHAQAGDARPRIGCIRLLPGIGRRGRVPQRGAQRAVDHLMDQRRFARAGYAAYHHHHAQRNLHVDILQVMRARAEEFQHVFGIHGAAAPRCPNAQLAAQIAGSHGRLALLQQIVVGAFIDDVSAVLSGSGPQVEDVVGRLHHLRVVLHHQDRVAQVAQLMQDADEPRRVARVQPDGRLVQHIAGSHQARPEAGGELNALRLAT